jgi:predicted dienelactone hydrolase
MNMHIVTLVAIGLLFGAGWYWSTHPMHPKSPKIGLKEFVFIDESRTFEGKPRVLEVAVWYPTNSSVAPQKVQFGIWKIKDAVRDAPLPVDKKFPLIVFSHGYSANQWVNTWFAEHLAEHGYIVAMVRHYGNSYRNMIPELCARPWNRPQDMSFALDKLLTDSGFAAGIDADRIGAAGFSQGGIACFWVAGVRASLTPENIKRQITVVNDPSLRMLHFKDISSERLQQVLDDFTLEDFKRANCSYHDERFKAVFAIAPGIDEENLMFMPQGLAQALTPMHITIGAADTGLIEQADFFAAHIPNCSFTLIPGCVTHMTMLNEGTNYGKLSKPSYTLDDSSVDRGKVHEIVAAQAIDFFNAHLK